MPQKVSFSAYNKNKISKICKRIIYRYYYYSEWLANNIINLWFTVVDCPIPDLDMTSYADDFTLLAFHPNIVEAETKANQHPTALVGWANVKQVQTTSHCSPEIQRDSVHFGRIPTSPGSTHKCESVTRWSLRTEPLKSWALRWIPTSLSALVF